MARCLKYSHQFSTTPSTEARIVIKFLQTSSKINVATEKKKFKNVLQSNDRVQNTEAAADFKSFQVDVTLNPSSHYLNPILREDR